MIDVLRKHVAPQYRILVDAKAFLNTTINDAVLFLTASQIELMRNLVDYANRRTTFVSDYYIGYYLSPDDTDWNLIQAIVADLESKLMGNNNVIWGYTDRYSEVIADTEMPAGHTVKEGALVPEGEVWEITGMGIIVVSGSCSRVRLGYKADTAFINVGEVLTPTSDVLNSFNTDLILKEGDRTFFRVYDLTLNDSIYAYAWGSKMEVPA